MVSVTESMVARPADPAGVAEVLRAASASGKSVQIQGAATKAHWGTEYSTVDVVLNTRRLTGVTEHEPGDLVATVRAGTPMRDLQAVLGLAGQRLTLESGSPDATIGGVLAAGEAGPLRLRYGSGRDLLIGVEFVRADGIVARSGGKVVKNVAGYDLGRLLCGSYGTVGVITSATFKLHPIPAARTWVVYPLSTNGDLTRLVLNVLNPAVAPSAVEVHLPPEGAGSLAVLLEGSRDGVARRCADLCVRLGASAAPHAAPPPWWGRYPFEPGDVGLKLAAPVSGLAGAIEALRLHLGDATTVCGSAGNGVVYVGAPGSIPSASLSAAVRKVRERLHGTGGTCIVLTAPPWAREGVDLWGPVAGLSLMRRIKEQFDPTGRFAAGRFVGGI
jgi:glycolate oxidase FAD binding subunit